MRRAILSQLLVAVTVAVGGLCGCSGAEGVRRDTTMLPILFEGVQEVSDTRLREFARRELRSFVTHAFNPVDLSDAAYAMERGLHGAGHARARVQFQVLPSEASPKRVLFQIVEGPYFELGDVTFPGAQTFSADRLSAFVSGGGRGLLSLSQPPFVRSSVDAGVGRVENLYLLAGHSEVRVGPASVQLDDAGGRADVVVPIQEGPRFTFGELRVEGTLPGALRRELSTSLQLDGQAYYLRAVNEAESRARVILHEHGHLLASVRGTVTVDADRDRVELTLSVVAGPVLMFDGLKLSGAERTRPSFVRQQLNLSKGDVLRGSVLADAINSLHRTGVFRRVDLVPKPLSDVGEQRASTLLARLEERDARSVELMFGYGSYEQLRAAFGYQDRHIGGTGRVLDASVFGSLKNAGLEVRGRDPYVLGRDHELSVGGRYEVREEPSFDERTVGMDVGVRSSLTADLTLNTGYQLTASDADNREARVRGAEERGFIRTAGVFGQLVHDTRNDPLFPSSGHRSVMRVGYNFPSLGGELKFWELDVRTAHYVKLGEGTVLAFGGRFHAREVLDRRRSLPIQERLFLGGDNSVRSFRESELGPSDRSGDPRGGLTAVDAHVELRQRLLGSLEGALFYDVGNVGPNSFELGRKFGQALGVGLRYRLPVGPLRLDFGYNPGERFAAKDSWALHLSFGFSF